MIEIGSVWSQCGPWKTENQIYLFLFIYDATLFVYFSYFITYIHTFIQSHSSVAIRWGLSPFLHRLFAQWGNLPVVPSRESIYYLVNFGQFPISWSRIRIHNTDSIPDPRQPNECGSTTLEIGQVLWFIQIEILSYLFMILVFMLSLRWCTGSCRPRPLSSTRRPS